MTSAAAATVQSCRDERAATRLLYYGSKFAGQTAQNLWLAALFVIAGTSSSAAIDLGSLFAAILLGSLLFGAVGGAFVDRFGAARGYCIGALGRLAVVGVALLVLDGSSTAWAVAFGYSAVSQVFTPAEMALVRTVQRDNVGGGHSMLVSLQYAGQGAGMLVLAPALYLWGGTGAMLAGAVVGFVMVAMLTISLAWRLRGTPAAQSQSTSRSLDLGATLKYFSGESRAIYAVVAMSLKTMVSRAIVIALPFYLERDMGLGEETLIYLVVPGCLGVGIGLLWSARRMTLASAPRAMKWSLIGMAVSVLALAALDYGVTAAAQYSYVPPVARLEASLNTTFAVAVPIAVLLGIVLTTSLVAARVVFTETAPQQHQGRVFAVQEMLSEAVVVAPLLLAGVGVQYTGARTTLAVIGVLTIAAVFLLAVAATKRQPSSLAERANQPPEAVSVSL